MLDSRLAPSCGKQPHQTFVSKGPSVLQTPDPVQLILYLNGIMMFDGPFRSYDEELTQICVADLMDGYFPSELQDKYPEGVPFKVCISLLLLLVWDVLLMDSREHIFQVLTLCISTLILALPIFVDVIIHMIK